MKLHLVGGFLGSGKTTAIIQAARAMIARGQRVGVITNDQGRYLVDTAFYRLSAIPTVEVTGGCFCCNYDDLDQHLAQLISAVQPDVIFAESVGSCADIVATVIKPLMKLGSAEVQPSSFSVFTDARLLRYRLLNREMPFSEDVVYIFDKQIEEAGLVVINKMDLLDDSGIEKIEQLFTAAHPGKPFLFQSSLSEQGVRPWIDRIERDSIQLPDQALEVDYQRYGAGEERLAWLDETIRLDFPADGGKALLRDIIASITGELARRGAAIGHLKIMVETAHGSAKLSIPTLDEPGWEDRVPDVQGEARLLLNARVEISADTLRELVYSALVKSGVRFTIHNQDAFHPQPPNPTHRIS